VVSFLEAQRGPIGRVEIPSTYRHWEAAYAAPDLSLARGWERQLDRAYNPIFYADELDPHAYRRWLADNGVAYVALPDTQLDDSSLLERDRISDTRPVDVARFRTGRRHCARPRVRALGRARRRLRRPDRGWVGAAPQSPGRNRRGHPGAARHTLQVLTSGAVQWLV
jgi:hypothetical protein